MLAFTTNGLLTGINWKALEDQEMVRCSYDEGTAMMLPVEPPLVHCTMSGNKGCECG